jgi:hypothetical protein
MAAFDRPKDGGDAGQGDGLRLTVAIVEYGTTGLPPP